MASVAWPQIERATTSLTSAVRQRSWNRSPHRSRRDAFLRSDLPGDRRETACPGGSGSAPVAAPTSEGRAAVSSWAIASERFREPLRRMRRA